MLLVAETFEYLLYQLVRHERHMTIKPEPFLDLFDGDASRVGRVDQTKRVPDRFEVKVHRYVVHKPFQRFHLELLRRPEALHTVHDLLLDLDRRFKYLLFKPSMLEAVLRRNTRLWVLIQHTRDQALCLVRHAHPDFVFKLDALLQHVAEDLRAVIALERWVTT